MAAILFFTSELMVLHWFRPPFLKRLAIITPYRTSNHYLLKCKLLRTMMMMIMSHPQPITPGILFCHKQIFWAVFIPKKEVSTDCPRCFIQS